MSMPERWPNSSIATAGRIGLFARQWCQSPEDVVQQAYIELVACRPAPENPTAWLFAAVRRHHDQPCSVGTVAKEHEVGAARQWFERPLRARAPGGFDGGTVG